MSYILLIFHFTKKKARHKRAPKNCWSLPFGTSPIDAKEAESITYAIPEIKWSLMLLIGQWDGGFNVAQLERGGIGI